MANKKIKLSDIIINNNRRTQIEHQLNAYTTMEFELPELIADVIKELEPFGPDAEEMEQTLESFMLIFRKLKENKQKLTEELKAIVIPK